jgi:hypothetical protein
LPFITLLRKRWGEMEKPPPVTPKKKEKEGEKGAGSSETRNSKKKT